VSHRSRDSTRVQCIRTDTTGHRPAGGHPDAVVSVALGRLRSCRPLRVRGAGGAGDGCQVMRPRQVVRLDMGSNFLSTCTCAIGSNRSAPLQRSDSGFTAELRHFHESSSSQPHAAARDAAANAIPPSLARTITTILSLNSAEVNGRVRGLGTGAGIGCRAPPVLAASGRCAPPAFPRCRARPQPACARHGEGRR
jgi:hypothetical protein